MGDILPLIFALILSLGVAVFAIQNSLMVVVKFLHWSFETSLVIIILGAACIGAMVIFLLHLFSQIRLRWDLRTANQRVRELEGEIAKLKAIPPQSEPVVATTAGPPAQKEKVETTNTP